MAERAARVKREIRVLIGLVLLVDAIFIGGYFLAGIFKSVAGVKVVFVVVWTVVTLAVVLRSLARIRSIHAGDG
jgi:hypothetical protein